MPNKTIIITGVGGLVGSAAAEYFHEAGYNIVGVDNDCRGKLLHDPKASTLWNIERLEEKLLRFRNFSVNVQDRSAMAELFSNHGAGVAAVIHTAAQTSHDGELWRDFGVNAIGTLSVLDAWRHFAPGAVFIYTSTIKVYGGHPNSLEYVQLPTRYDLLPWHGNYRGFNESTPIDQSGMSSFFGRSKTAADLYVQEFAEQFKLPAVCLRASCITGGMHSGSEAHGMLAYMMQCAQTKKPYRIHGYNGLQVRDQIHVGDLVKAMDAVIKDPPSRCVFNIGGGRENACSINEAIHECELLTGNQMEVSHHPERGGDHRFWITDNSAFTAEYPEWRVETKLHDIFEDILREGRARW